MADVSRDVAMKIVDVTVGCRLGCTDNVAALVVSNTGFFILKRLGFEFEEIKQMFKEVIGKENEGG